MEGARYHAVHEHTVNQINQTNQTFQQHYKYITEGQHVMYFCRNCLIGFTDLQLAIVFPTQTPQSAIPHFHLGLHLLSLWNTTTNHLPISLPFPNQPSSSLHYPSSSLHHPSPSLHHPSPFPHHHSSSVNHLSTAVHHPSPLSLCYIILSFVSSNDVISLHSVCSLFHPYTNSVVTEEGLQGQNLSCSKCYT